MKMGKFIVILFFVLFFGAVLSEESLNSSEPLPPENYEDEDVGSTFDWESGGTEEAGDSDSSGFLFKFTIIFFILIILGLIGFFIYRHVSKKNNDLPESQPFSTQSSTSQSSVVEPVLVDTGVVPNS